MSSHRIRGSVVALALAIAALLITAGAAAAQGTIPDTTRFNRLLSVHIEPARPCIHDSIRVVIGDACSPCLGIQSFTGYNDVSFALVLDAHTRAQCEAESCHVVGTQITLPPQPANPYALAVVNIVVNVPPDSLSPAGSEVRFTRSLRYAVSDSCEVQIDPPPPPPDFIRHVAIAGGVAPCDTCAPVVCAGTPLEVQIAGALPDQCWEYDSMELDATPAFYLSPPIINVFIRRVGDVCTQNPSSFSGSVTLPPSPPGRWPFIVREIITEVHYAPIASLERRYSYVARDTCGPPPLGCVFPYLDPLPLFRDPGPWCNLVLRPGDTGTVVFASHGDGALAGLQGTFESTPGLDIVGIHQVGPAEGMHLLVGPTGSGGVHFVLFADHGAPIPQGPGNGILAVTVHADPHLHPGDHAFVRGTTAAASDSNGTSVPICPIETFAAVQAVVCIRDPQTCDVNGDGATNVADLVGMARCWFHPETCPDSSGMRPDCTHDGAFHLDDILCCARGILGGGPGDSTTHDATRLQVSFGSPQVLNGRVRVPLVIHGASEMNGALLRVRFPGDRYTAEATGDSPGLSASSAWMPLTEPGDGDIVVGVLRLDDAAPDDITVPLEFTLKPGQSPGGELSIDQGNILAPDGSGLRVDLSKATGTLPNVTPPGVVSRVDLLVGPNPTSGLARFTVMLPAAGMVDLSIYDLAGRRVATPWHGAMDAGQRDVPWDGSALHRGFYFARLSVNGEVRTRRVLLTPGL